jgi:hypothetical protein
MFHRGKYSLMDLLASGKDLRFTKKSSKLVVVTSVSCNSTSNGYYTTQSPYDKHWSRSWTYVYTLVRYNDANICSQDSRVLSVLSLQGCIFGV